MGICWKKLLEIIFKYWKVREIWLSEKVGIVHKVGQLIERETKTKITHFVGFQANLPSRKAKHTLIQSMWPLFLSSTSCVQKWIKFYHSRREDYSVTDEPSEECAAADKEDTVYVTKPDNMAGDGTAQIRGERLQQDGRFTAYSWSTSNLRTSWYQVCTYVCTGNQVYDSNWTKVTC